MLANPDPITLAAASVDISVAFTALGVGIAIVLGMILVLRANAFLALITAALAVSVIAPSPAGELSRKVVRVAEAFGETAAGIGILIAAAAIIGKCLMESGAADRVVQSAVGVTGEKRAPWALTGSGFVLSVPIFFDTVFYLLVPLARSLFRRTERNYLLYLCAIAAGGAITHTLVPPTPGPLLMADTLGVSVGRMILVGAIVAVPAAIVGVFTSVLIDRWVTVPFREVGSSTDLAAEDGRWEESEAGGRPLPGLFVSLLPILLPVLMISVATVVDSLHQAELKSLRQQAEADGVRFAEDEAAAVAGVEPERLESSYQTIYEITANLGNPTFALLIATAASIWLLAKYGGFDRSEVGAKVEDALASGGVVILITAAGGAFGKMLKEAGVGDAIQQLANDWEATGLTLLLIAWGVAAIMKIAQGSSTTAMITVSGIFSGGLSEAGALPYDPVYLCTAIGAGSLMGSWMNDSGFWIFTKMGGLTESESLRSWTPILAVLSVTALVATLLLATIMPMTAAGS